MYSYQYMHKNPDLEQKAQHQSILSQTAFHLRHNAPADMKHSSGEPGYFILSNAQQTVA